MSAYLLETDRPKKEYSMLRRRLHETVGCFVEVIAEPHSLLSRTFPITQFDESNSENARVVSSQEPRRRLYMVLVYSNLSDLNCKNKFELQGHLIGSEKVGRTPGG